MKGLILLPIALLALCGPSANAEIPEGSVPVTPLGECPIEDESETVFLPAKESLENFFVCEKGVPILRYCEFGTIFVQAKQTCLPPVKPRSPVGTCPPVDGEFATHLPDSERNDIFYKCHEGVPVLHNCPPGLIFDPELSVCAFPNN